MAQTIVVTGAGAAGLMAARILSENGHRVIITEADNRTGGRVHTVSGNNFDGVVEAGAEFVHGNLTLTRQLLQEANIGLQSLTGNMYTVRNGQWKMEEDLAPGWDLLMEKMQQLKEDMTIAGFLDANFQGAAHTELRRSVQGFAEGFDLADINKANVFAVRNEWQHGMEQQFRVQGGYGQLISHLYNQCLAKGCEVHSSFIVKTINRNKGAVKLLSADGRSVTGDKAIITIPLGVLQAGPAHPAAIHFDPSIDPYLVAARKMGYGTVIKFNLQFREAFWKHHADNAGFILSDQPVPTWWTQLPDTRPVLTGWLGGQQAAHAENPDEAELLALAIRSLSAIFNMRTGHLRQMLIAYRIDNWQRRPFAAGAYSYSTLHTKQAQELFKLPVDDTLYFAGEAFYEGPAPGTVEAALVSGKNVAETINRAGI